MRDQVKSLVDLTAKHPKAAAFAEAGKKLTESLTAWEESVVQPKQKTQQDIINFRNMLSNNALDLMNAVAESDAGPTAGMKTRFADLDKAWSERQGRLRADPGPGRGRLQRPLQAGVDRGRDRAIGLEASCV